MESGSNACYIKVPGDEIASRLSPAFPPCNSPMSSSHPACGKPNERTPKYDKGAVPGDRGHGNRRRCWRDRNMPSQGEMQCPIAGGWQANGTHSRTGNCNPHAAAFTTCGTLRARFIGKHLPIPYPCKTQRPEIPVQCSRPMILD